MAKRLFLLLLISLMAVGLTPSILTSADKVEVVRIDDSRAVETVPLPEPEPEPEPEPVVEAAPEPEPVTYTRVPSAGVAEVAPAPSMINYNVTIVTSKIVGTGLSYYDIYRTGKFIYAHNTANLLGNLVYLNPGDVFTVTESGVVKTYQVTEKIVYEKAANGYLNGSKAVTKEAEYNANGYDISIMTCYGTMYGNGDASHRLMVFANAI